MSTANNFPLVSIVMATYNGERFLRIQLDSVFEQTYSNLEVIVMDDGSSDQTVAILREYEHDHANMQLHVNEKNIGHIKTFEKGIILSRGNFIALCDQDDVWDKKKIEILMDQIKDFGMAFCDSAFIDEDGNLMHQNISDIKNLATYKNCEPFIIGNCISGHASIFTRQIALSAIPFPPEIIHDWWLAFVASSRGTVSFVNEVLVSYRQHSANFIGAIKVKGRNKKEANISVNNNIRNRIQCFYEICPGNVEAKLILAKLNKSYRNFSFKNNLLRMMTFFKYEHSLLAIKKRSPFRKWLFCLKMFFKII
jgi:glycosyltransferase involved in cell wall biosynthesis